MCEEKFSSAEFVVNIAKTLEANMKFVVANFAAFLFLVCSFVDITKAAPQDWPELLTYDPVAPQKATVLSSDGKARFTVLTSRVLRMEYSGENASGDAPAFEDRATTAFLNRKLESVPSFKTSREDGYLKIQTDDVVLSYKEGSPFSASSLSVDPAQSAPTGAFKGWVYGLSNAGNLLGTIKSLDQLAVTSLNCTENSDIRVHDEDLHCAWGLISRLGFATVDDSATYALDPKTGWWDGPNKDDVDTYLFAHGHDYKAALQDFVQISGRPAMPPRAAFGLWWTRWYNLNSIPFPEEILLYDSTMFVCLLSSR